jgi:hypothetical protein
MAYYDSLTSAWNSPTQPPSGVTGAGLVGGDTTQQKIDKINAWTVTGTIPTSFFTTSDQIANCINYPEFKALTANQQSDLLAALSIQGQILGGSSHSSLLVNGMLLDYFPGGGPTITALKALAKAITETWCQTNGYPFVSPTLGALTIVDAENAGLV